jgi:hypothetical protein
VAGGRGQGAGSEEGDRAGLDLRDLRQPAPGGAGAPEVCVIYADERQWVPASGQRWTTPEALADGERRVDADPDQAGLQRGDVSPVPGLGQRALLVRIAGGNLLWSRSSVSAIRWWGDVGRTLLWITR